MRVGIKSYISLILDVLIKIVLPNLNSPFARIQLSYAIDMLNQLQNQVEYRNDVIRDDFAGAKEILDITRTALNDNHIGMPEEITSFSATTLSDHVHGSNLREALTQVETASARALDLIYEKREDIKNFAEIEDMLMDLSLRYVRRQGKLKAPTINLELLESG